MARELKFRAWNERLKLMTHFDHGPSIKFNTEGSEGYWGMVFNTDEKVSLAGYEQVMQFIGQTDESGREIYEGDILEATVDRCKYFATQKFVIEFIDGAFQLINPEDSSEGYFWIDVLDNSAKVVGNIYSNPELLRQD